MYFFGLPLKLAEWIGKNLFGLDIEDGWADKQVKWIKGVVNDLIEWIFAPIKGLIKLLFRWWKFS